MIRLCSLTCLVAVLALAASATAKDTYPDSIKVEIIGHIKTGIVAIGGETTGTTITSGKTTWELDLGDNEELKKLAADLNGAHVEVKGLYVPRAGVEVPIRHIVKVSSIRDLKEK